ncbi:TIGR01619 family protein [Pasteurellaceae bacterium TAE3-ERU1]|nr:TIGR01619 family protein [Pasteurellaceae bacterium TAE3-ERU1]
MEAQHYQWETYRTLINDQESVVMFNAALVMILDQLNLPYAMSFSMPFEDSADDTSPLDREAKCEAHLQKLAQILVPLIGMSHTSLVGFIVMGNTVTAYFYTRDVALFKSIFSTLDYQDLIVQHDPECDIYYDFLLPSALEMKFNATALTLDSLSQDGINLAEAHLITHKFRFDEADKMQAFVDHGMREFGAIEIRYTQEPVQDGESAFFIVELQHELVLSDDSIFDFVKAFDTAANQFEGDYLGWECQVPKRHSHLH